MKIEFASREELFNKVYKVLTIRKKELLKENIEVTEEVLWTIFSKEVFIKMKDLMLSDIVDKILKTDKEEIRSYLIHNNFM